MLLSQFIRQGTGALLPLYPEAEAHNIILMLCSGLLGTRSYTHIVEPEYAIEPARQPALDLALSRLVAGEPVQYVLGFAEFCGLKFNVTPDVLIPRQETEMLVRGAVQEASRLIRMREAYGRNAAPVRILDLCTGSGCIAWSVAVEVPGVEVVGVDVSEPALRLAESQPLSRKGVVNPVFVKADILEDSSSFDRGQFDIVVSNPPYVLDSERLRMRANVLEYEPELALFVPDTDPLLFYRAVADWSQRFLSSDGKGFVEINESLGPETAELFRAGGFGNVTVSTDIFDRNRVVSFSKTSH